MERGEFPVMSWTDCVLATSCIAHIGWKHIHYEFSHNTFLKSPFKSNPPKAYECKMKDYQCCSHHYCVYSLSKIARASWRVRQSSSSGQRVPRLWWRFQVPLSDGQVWRESGSFWRTSTSSGISITNDIIMRWLSGLTKTLIWPELKKRWFKSVPKIFERCGEKSSGNCNTSVPQWKARCKRELQKLGALVSRHRQISQGDPRQLKIFDVKALEFF